jgi:hypothetical protein
MASAAIAPSPMSCRASRAQRRTSGPAAITRTPWR